MSVSNDWLGIFLSSVFYVSINLQWENMHAGNDLNIIEDGWKNVHLIGKQLTVENCNQRFI